MCLLQGQQVLLKADPSFQSLQFIILKYHVIQKNMVKFHTTQLLPSQDINIKTCMQILLAVYFYMCPIEIFHPRYGNIRKTKVYVRFGIVCSLSYCLEHMSGE